MQVKAKPRDRNAARERAKASISYGVEPNKEMILRSITELLGLQEMVSVVDVICHCGGSPEKIERLFREVGKEPGVSLVGGMYRGYTLTKVQ